MVLEEIIIEKIKTEGPISFYDFMDMALYYPGLGYYTSTSEKIGRDGDYLTSPVITSLFGTLIARQLDEMMTMIGGKEFTIVEYGPGNGKLCHDILQALSTDLKAYNHIHYRVVERSGSCIKQQQDLLPENVVSIKSITELDAFDGCVLSNEVPDNFPVHRVVMQHELMEIFVDYKDGFVEALQPASACLRSYFDDLDITLPAGFQTEINLDAIAWLDEISQVLRKGFLMTIDYGDISRNLYRNSRSDGTLLCYYQHHRNSNPYMHIGTQDITTHLNFSALAHWGEKYALHCDGLTTQSQFLLSLGLIDQVRQIEKTQSNFHPQQQSFLIHDFLLNMGSKIKVLIQHKGIAQPKLKGMQFATRVAA